MRRTILHNLTWFPFHPQRIMFKTSSRCLTQTIPPSCTIKKPLFLFKQSSHGHILPTSTRQVGDRRQPRDRQRIFSPNRTEVKLKRKSFSVPRFKSDCAPINVNLKLKSLQKWNRRLSQAILCYSINKFVSLLYTHTSIIGIDSPSTDRYAYNGRMLY